MTDDTTVEDDDPVVLDHDAAIDYDDEPTEIDPIETDQAETPDDPDQEALAYRRGLIGGGAAGALTAYLVASQLPVDIGGAVGITLLLIVAAVGIYPYAEPYIDHAIVLILGGGSDE